MQRGADDTSYANAIEIYLERLNADVWTVEAKSDEGQIFELLKPYRETMRKKIAVGVVSHRTLQVESPEEVAELVRLALEHIPVERLVVCSDCGMGREGMSRRHALYKMVSLVLGTNVVRKELGIPEAECMAADPRYSLISTS
jgi:5-methyltetrahydropteroyltriglutamate--homocysteine methyltransferase